MAEIERIIVHCSDSSFGDADLIRHWHVDERGWRDIGYNIIIYNGYLKNTADYDPSMDGRIVQGRKIDLNTYLDGMESGAHAYGFNSTSIGVCLIGVKKFTKNQFNSLHFVYQFWKNIVPGIKIIGHYDVSKTKTCPNFNVFQFKSISDETFLGIKNNWGDLPC